METLLKVYGERNTSTNYLRELIKLNLDTHELPPTVPSYILRIQEALPGREFVRDMYYKLTYHRNLGWKHTKVKDPEVLKNYSIIRNSNISFITMTKNPYSWLLSLHRRPYHQYYSEKPDFKTFLQTSWKTVRRDNAKRYLSNPIELWNIKNASYLPLKSLDALNLKTENLFHNPEAEIKKIHKTFSIPTLRDNFKNYERSTKDKSKNYEYYRDYYLNERWKDELSKDTISIINNTLDKSLMSKFGYDVL